MRKRRLLLAVGACVAAVALTTGTAIADPIPAPPPYPPVVGVGAQTTQELFNFLCNKNTNFRNPMGSTNPNDRICQSYDVQPQPGTITTRDPAVHPECQNIHRPEQGGAGFDSLIAHPTCVDFARVVASSDSATRPPGFTYIPLGGDALTYAVRGDGLVPTNLDVATLKKIYSCDPTITAPSNPNGFKPLLGSFGAGNRTFFLKALGLTDSANYTTLNPCVRDTDSNGVGLLANDGRVLTDKKNLITYSTGPYLSQLFKVVADIHGNAVLGSINGIIPAVPNDKSFMARPVYDVVRTSDVPGPGPIHDMFVGPTSKVCSDPTDINRFGFNLRSDCGDTTLQTTN